MKTFLEYSNSFEIAYNPYLLAFGTKDSDYCIYQNSSPLLTPEGNVFLHPSERVIHLLITDLQLFNCSYMQVLPSPIFYSFRKDIFKTDDGMFLHLWKGLLATDPVEYVKGLISIKLRFKEQYSETLTEVAGVQAYLGLIMQKQAHGKTTLALIKEGEGDATEFKSTLRWDIQAGKTNPAIERACLKTVSAFLNTKGGNLLIGVRDDGSIEGIETDIFANEDKFLLHLWTLIRNCIGKNFSHYFRTRLEKIDEKTICIVNCLPSNMPVFLRQPGFDEEMYIRVGPSSNALDISEALKYIDDHFRK